MKISKQARRDAKNLFRSCLAKEGLDENRAREIVRKVAEVKPRGYVGILSHFHRLVKVELERRTARIESATPLSSQLQKEFSDKLARIYGPGLVFSFAQNPALLGGVRIRVGSDVYDGSVQSRLRALQESF
jgi:F-type H+-transporting ATPase subunit delta